MPNSCSIRRLLPITAAFLLLAPTAAIAVLESEALSPADGAEVGWNESISISGDVALLGASGGDGITSFSGTAYIFRYNGSSWVEEQKLMASDGATGALFGYKVSVSDGVALIGAISDNATGSAYVFRFNGTQWVEEAKLTASDGEGSDRFGEVVSIAGDVALVGAAFDDDNGAESGSAYVFRYNGTNWVEEQKLKPSVGAVLDLFGASGSISGDTALVGAIRDDDHGTDDGALYVFRHNGSSWVEEQKLTASDEGAHYFGFPVSIAGDTAIVGALASSPEGAAYVLRFNGSNWVEEQKLTASDGALSNRFGVSVSLLGDTALVGAQYADGGEAAYLFRFNGLNWIEETKISSLGGTLFEGLSEAVAVSETFVIAGGHGAAYAFRLGPPPAVPAPGFMITLPILLTGIAASRRLQR